MLSERGGRVHQLRIVHPNLVGAGKPTARAVNQEAVSVSLPWRHLVNRNLGIASEGRCPAHRASCSLERRVDQIDEMTNVLVLPAAAPLIHGVAEADARVGIGEPERSAGAKVPERTRIGTERALGHRELEPE